MLPDESDLPLVEIGKLGHRFRRAALSVRLGGAPRFTFDGPPSQRPRVADDFGVAAAQRSFGTVMFSNEKGDKLSFPLRLAGWSPIAEVSRGLSYESEFSLTGDLVDERLANLLAAPGAPAGGCTLVYQMGPDETPDGLLARIADDGIEIKPRVGEELLAPPALGCLLRPGAMSTADFFDLVAGVIGSESPSLVGWRVLPGDGRGSTSAVSFSVSERDRALELAPEVWRPLGTFGPVDHDKAAGLLILHHDRRETPYAPLLEVLPELLDTGYPSSHLFGTNDPIPGAPCWIRYGTTEWFVEEIVVRINAAKGANEPAWIHRVDLVLRQMPSLSVPDALPARIAQARVEGWSEDGVALLMTPEGSDWRIAGREPPFGESLAVVCLTPAHFGQDRGGIYVRPLPDDPRHVLLVQGQPPVSAGSSMAKDTEIEEEEVDIQLRAAAIELVGNGARLSTGNEELKASAETLVEISGTVQVQGELDVS